MRTILDKELTQLHRRLVALGRRVQAQLDDALVALATGDTDAAEGIVGRHRQLDQASTEIEKGLLRLLALQAPVASDLRLVTGLLHVNEHLERMGGLCANVANAVPGLASRPPPAEVLATLNEMGAHLRRVVTASLACLADGDVGAAERLPALDQAVDRCNDRVVAQITASNDPTALCWAPSWCCWPVSWSASAIRRSMSVNRSASSALVRSASCSHPRQPEFPPTSGAGSSRRRVLEPLRGQIAAALNLAAGLPSASI
jgi:phosphate transport system protein